MEEVERINKMAVESGHKMLTLMGQLKQQPQDELLCRNLISQADDSLVKFKSVVSLLGNRFSVARARRFKSLSIPNLPENLLIETLDSTKTPLQLLPKASSEADPKSKKPVPDTHAIFDDVWGSLSVKPPQILQFRPNEMQRMHFYNQQQQQMKYHAEIYNCGLNLKFDGSSNTMSSNRSFMSALSMDVSVANSFQVTGLPKPSGQTSEQLMRRRCTFKGEDGSLKCVSNGKCHCSKRRKVRMKRSIKVPAISNKIADIPPDEYSWRKYGQKPIKGSPYPRGYYKCSSMRGCPARKHVERCVDEPAMLVVTYEGDHNHSRLT